MIDKKIFVLIPTYNAEKTIRKVFERIPKDFLARINQFLVVNDSSTDNTLAELKSLKESYTNMIIIDKKANEGYAGAQKTGYRIALENNADIVVLLHADGQYAPEEMPKLVEPLINNEADIVQGSRMLEKGALKGGMPFYKVSIWVGEISLAFRR